MLVAVKDSQSCWEVFQASFVLKRTHKRMNRMVIEALVRERLELAIAQKSAWWLTREGLSEGSRQVESWMREQLWMHGLELAELELVGLARTEHAHTRDDLFPLYQENWLEQIPTADGFFLSFSVVMRLWVPATLVGYERRNLYHDELKCLSIDFFSPLDSETALSKISVWQQSLRPILEHLETTYRTVDGLLAAVKNGLLRRDAGVIADTVWVTRCQLKAGEAAFQPGQRYGFLDAYQLFFMLQDRQQLHERYRLGRG